MKGHIRERSAGHWAIVIDVKDPTTGKRRRKWHSFKGTKRQAQDERNRLLASQTAGSYVDPSKETLREHFERWLDQIRTQVSPRTFERYAEIARKTLVPLLGSATLSKLQPEAISAAYAKLLTSGRAKGTGGLSARSVTHAHRILRQALQQAVVWKRLNSNPASLVKPPRVERKKVATLTADEAARLLDAIKHSRVYWPTMIALATGMRRGEICALRWRAIDLDRGTVHVLESLEQTRDGIRFKPPKSGKTRSVTLPAFATAELRRLKRQQAEELLAIGVRQGPETLVCGRADGEPHKPLSLTYEFARLIRRLKDLPRVRFHDLRHSHATILLTMGTHPKIAQERLGHSSISVTLDLYSHVVGSLQDEAATRVDDAIGGAINRGGGVR